ncbi:ABC-2 type transport system ATP-binding protein [Catenuloplanes nepalensis]|uniref:ABC-2 type transport system ATP-binding protein n=1 Tax=Catenuloplanes nepalensis TaxID=587533 RepID=A0ABT9N0I4_9ACTN|nr:ABC transporter ATP-binding protein [Catenuloplanes nepalensis]MDP9797204.1 ABC-2 type transport system ATP-binding protein [Catenuloplanes nepalensis]
MSIPVSVRDLRVRYGDTVALDGLSFDLDGGKIYGLLGRNGSGKTTLLSVLAAFRRASAGTVLVDGEDPFENARVTRQVCLIRDNVDAEDTDRVSTVLKLAAQLRPHFDADYAARLAKQFDLPLRKRVSGLSRGGRSALGVTIGLATRAPLTIFDESYLGLDAPSRYAFYQELVADYAENPRTIILSTHLIEEVANLFEEVLIIDHGRLLAHEETDTLRRRGATVTGPAGEVDAFVAGNDLAVLGEKRLGGTKATTVYGTLTDGQRREAAAAMLEITPVGLQDLFIHLTAAGSRR